MTALASCVAIAACGSGDDAGDVAVVAGGHRVNSIGMQFVRIPAGEFRMGSPSNEPGHKLNEGPVHRVRITRDFEMGIHEVTNSQFRTFVETTGYVTEAERDLAGGLGIDFDTGRVAHTLSTSTAPSNRPRAVSYILHHRRDP